MPLGDGAIKNYLESVRLAMRAERTIKSELLSRGPESAVPEASAVPAGTSVRKARLAAWNTDYTGAMRNINQVLSPHQSAAGGKSADKDRIEASVLKDEIWGKFVAEKFRNAPKAKAHVLRGLVQYSRNRLGKARDEWAAALELAPGDAFAKGAGQVALELETGKTPVHARREPLQLEFVESSLVRIAGLEPSSSAPARLRAAVAAKALSPGASNRQNTETVVSRPASVMKKSRTAGVTAAASGLSAAAEKSPALSGTVNEESARKHYVRGLVYYGSNDLPGAQREWLEALRLDPGQVKARKSLERVKQELGRDK